MGIAPFEKDAYSVKTIEKHIKKSFEGIPNVKVHTNTHYDVIVVEFKETGQTFSIQVNEE